MFQVIEFNQMKCFKGFVDEVTAARRRGDLFDVQEILSNLAKLLGEFISYIVHLFQWKVEGFVKSRGIRVHQLNA